MTRDYQKGLYKDYELFMSKYEKLELKYALFQVENNMLKAIETINEKLKAQLANEKIEKELLAKEHDDCASMHNHHLQFAKNANCDSCHPWHVATAKFL